MVGASRVPWLFLAPALLLVGAVLVVPAALGLARSFTAPDDAGRTVFVGPLNYWQVLADRNARTAIGNGVEYALISAPVSVVSGLGLAAAITSVRRRETLRLLFLSPWLASPIAVGVLWRFFANNPMGLVNLLLSHLGRPLALGPFSNPMLALPLAAAVDVWRTSPLVAFLLVPGLLAIPGELRDQAAVDGATGWRLFRDVLVPTLQPLLAMVLLMRLADALGTSDTLFTLTHGGPIDKTTTLALYSYLRLTLAGDWTHGLATAWLIVALSVVLGAVCLWVAGRRR